MNIPVEEWSILQKKAGRNSFLGNIDTRWQISKDHDGLIVISQRTAKWFSSMICLFFIFLCVVIFYFQVPKYVEFVPLKIVTYFIVMCICIYFIIDLARVRSISWRKDGSYLEFTWGIFPFVNTMRIDPKGLSAEFRRFNHKNIIFGFKQMGVFLVSSDHSMSAICLARGKKENFLLPVFNAISKFLKEVEVSKST